ncbi:putative iron-sulfur cluster-binding metallochaperone [Kaarinaea lacus]
MSNCATTPTNTAICPVNGRSYRGVSLKTILHQLKKPWSHRLPEQAYYFCDDPHCDVVYFGENNLTLHRGDLRIEVGQKSQATNKTICYCFDVTTSDLASSKAREESRAFVIDQTRNATCDCEIKNPSGKCCLKDF